MLFLLTKLWPTCALCIMNHRNCLRKIFARGQWCSDDGRFWDLSPANAQPSWYCLTVSADIGIGASYLRLINTICNIFCYCRHYFLFQNFYLCWPSTLKLQCQNFCLWFISACQLRHLTQSSSGPELECPFLLLLKLKYSVCLKKSNTGWALVTLSTSTEILAHTVTFEDRDAAKIWKGTKREKEPKRWSTVASWTT